MSKNGYDQFFKKARQAAQSSAQSDVPNVPVRKKEFKPIVQPKGANKMAKKKKNEFPAKIVFICFLGLAATIATIQYFETIEKFISRLEVSAGSKAYAESAEINGGEKKEEVKGAAKEGEKAEAGKTEDAKTRAVASTESEDHLSKLAERSKELDAKEEELKRSEAEIASQKIELEKKMAELEAMRSKISAVLEEKVKTDDAKVDTLVQLYSNMKPQQAAKVVETIDEDLAIEVLARMKKKSAADIMNLLKPEKSQVLSEKFAGYKRK